jgi:hypothetical protein
VGKGKRGTGQVAKVIERVQAPYEVEEVKFGKVYKRLEQALESFVEDLEGLRSPVQRFEEALCWNSKRESSKREHQGRVHEVAGSAAGHAGAGEPAA